MRRDEVDVIPAVFARGTAVYDRKSTIHHWQLRDLVSAAENEHQFYLLYEQDVYRYDAAADEVGRGGGGVVQPCVRDCCWCSDGVNAPDTPVVAPPHLTQHNRRRSSPTWSSMPTA
jgi:hypothetical protein